MGRAVLIHAAVVGVFGVFLPWVKGVEFLNPVIMAAYACLSVLFAGPAAAQAFAAEHPCSMTDAIARMVMAVLYGECMVVALLLAGFTTLYTTHLGAAWFAPDMETLAAAGALGITSSFALAATAAWITLRFSAGAARAALRIVFLLLLVAFLFRSRWLPDVAATGALLCLLVALAALLALRGRMKPAE